jgi:hypothetical protein
MKRVLFLFVAALSLFTLLCAPATAARDPLTDEEIDQLRETAQMPNKRIELFIKFVSARILAIQQVQSDPKLTDRPKQVHDLLEDFNYLTDQLDDNLDMYSRQKADFRKSLKKAIEAYSDWQVKLRTLKETSKPEELKQYSFSLETATENVNAGADTTRELLAEQEEAHKKKGKSDKDDKVDEKKSADR